MGNQNSKRQCEEDPDLYDEDVSDITVSNGIIDVLLHRLIAHPFVVLRRQCQVNGWGRRHHLFPFTLFPVGYKQVRKHGFDALMKGIHGVIVLDLASFVTESLIAVYGGLPSYALHHQELSIQLSHYSLKFLSGLIIGPVYAASVQATVQTIRSGNPYNALDFLKLVLSRFSTWQNPSSAHPLRRMMPVWIISPMYASFSILRFITASQLQWRLFIWLKHSKEKRQETILPDLADSTLRKSADPLRPSIKGTYGYALMRYGTRAVALIVTDALLFPLEVVLNRLCIQGTRATIDNLDTGVDVVSVVFSYKGPVHCAAQIAKMSGISGFYKGFGALMLEAAVYSLLFGTVHFALSFSELEDRKLADGE